jgi:GTPase SAR1 family protein
MISKRYVKNLAKNYRFEKYIECSSTTGKNIKEIFKVIVKAIQKNTDDFTTIPKIHYRKE